ncbi:MAG: branched-chain amino acid ABC transporter permease [Erysipelothrix sp.]|nr:branched-chain amino acid ABC transporter permease [Erysipelothrix sp.]
MKKLNLKSYLINLLAITALYVLFKVLIGQGILNRYYVGVLIFIGVNIVLATSLNIATGFLGQLALGHAGFMAIGAYTAALTSRALILQATALPNILILLISLALAGFAALLASLIIGIPSLRLRGDYLGIITLGFGEVIRIVINNLNFTGKAQGLSGIANLVNFDNIFWITVVIVLMLYTFTNSRHGRAIVSIREDEIAAEAVGIPTIFYKIVGFSISAFFGGIGGGLYAHYISYLDPNIFSFMKSIEILVIVVLGGMGSLTGSIIAAIVLTILPEALREFANYRMLAYSFLLVIMMIFRPQGLFGTKEFSFSQFLHKLRYNQILSPRKKVKEVD